MICINKLRSIEYVKIMENKSILYIGKGVVCGVRDDITTYYPTKLFKSETLCGFEKAVETALSDKTIADFTSRTQFQKEFVAKGCLIHIEKWHTSNGDMISKETDFEYFKGKLTSSEIETLRNLL